MEVITIESQAYRELEDKLDTILQFVAAIKKEPEENPENIWVVGQTHEILFSIAKTSFLPHSKKTKQP